MFRSLQYKLLAWFLVFSLLTILLIVPFSLYYYTKKENISNVINKIDLIHVNVLKGVEAQSDFFSYDTKNPEYFKTKNSSYLQLHKQIENETIELVQSLENKTAKKKYGLNENLAEIKQGFIRSSELFDTIVSLLYIRGYKDFGIEGEMRRNIHQLENFENISQRTVLSLRRHEKDYIIRNDQEYIDKLHELGYEFVKAVNASSRLSKSEKDSTIIYINNYLDYFNQLVNLEQAIGIKSNTGLKLQLDENIKKVERQFAILMNQAEAMKQVRFKRLETAYLIFSFLLVIVSVLVSLMVSRGLVIPFKTLSDYLKKLIASDFKKKERILVTINSTEVEELYSDFNDMVKQLLKREEERDKAEKELRESEVRYRQLIKILPICVYEADINDRLYFVNNAFIDTFKYSRNDIQQGVNLIHLISDIDRPKLFFKDAVLKSEVIACNKNGDIFPALIFANSIIVDGEIKGSRGVIIDVSDRLLELKKLGKKTKDALDNHNS